jgi:hypothetical protein
MIFVLFGTFFYFSDLLPSSAAWRRPPKGPKGGKAPFGLFPGLLALLPLLTKAPLRGIPLRGAFRKLGLYAAFSEKSLAVKLISIK